jgi:hypothetical protein
MQMNWRLLTAINAAIALITIAVVIFAITRSGPEKIRAQKATQSITENKDGSESSEKKVVQHLDDFSQARVDNMGAVPAAELTQLMSRADPEQIAALAQKFNEAPVDAHTMGGLGVFFQGWTGLDPNAALVGAFQLSDVTLRKLAVRTVINSVSPSEAPGLIAYLSEHPDKDLEAECKNDFLGGLVASWSLLDPEAASKYMDALGDTKNNLAFRAREDIAYNWGSLDPSAALDWVRSQKGKDFVDAAALYDDMIRGWCLKDVTAAAAYIAQHLDDSIAERGASDVATAMFTHDPEQATAWITQMPEGQPRSSAESTVASMWTQKDPAAAAKWLGTLPENEQKDLAHRIAEIWIGKNFSEASQWIESLTGDVRDNALTAAVYRDGATDSESLSLALSIRNPDTQNDTIQNVIRSWAYRDPQAAETWVKNSPVSPEQQQQLFCLISEAQAAANEATAERVIIEH